MRRALVVSVAMLATVAGCTSSSGSTSAKSISPSPSSVEVSASAMTDGVRAAARTARQRAVKNARIRAAAAQQAAAHPPFTWRATHVTAKSLGKSWHDGCPVGPKQLRALHMTFWGFDHTAHRGTLIVRARSVDAYVSAFHKMYHHRFPIRRMRPVSVYGGDDNVSMRHDNTSAFNCRYAVSDGPKHWSMHAYGEAVDINTVENPYYLNGRVRPKKGEPYMDRSNVRPGMIVPGSVPVRAFSALGWGWGGNWSGSPDYQHFSSTGG